MLKELREKRGKAIADARAIHEKAGEEKRAMSDEERGNWSKAMDESDSLQQQIEDATRQQDADRAAAETALETAAKDTPPDKKTLEERQLAGFSEYLRTEKANVEVIKEFRAMQADLEVSGGYLAAPPQYVNELIQDMDDAHVIRQLARKFPLAKAVSLGAPSLDTDISSWAWGTEIGSPTEDSSLAFGGRELNPHPGTGLIKVSKDLIRVATMPVVNIVRERMAYEAGEAEDVAFMTGSGSNQPLGLFTASDDGISRGQDVSTGNTSSDIRFNSLKRVRYTLKAAYHAKAAWIMHRNVVRNVSLLKDGEGRYIWQESVVAGDPDRILQFPVHMSENAPSTFGSEGYMAILGDFNWYWIADAYDLEIQALFELYAVTNQNGYISRLKVDGMPTKEEAFVRSKLSA